MPPTASPQDPSAAHDDAAAAAPDVNAPAATATQPPTTAGPQKGAGHVGHYHILEKLGEGNTGTVYRAESGEGPDRRVVALKIVKLAVDGRAVVARFDFERHALAAMDHPGVTRVLDAGLTESGRPFFVSEFVPGTPVVRYCDNQRYGIRRRLELFLEVCAAVQHGHQKGIVHGDLRPANVLVAEGERGAPVPTVIDFGLAAALHPSLPHHGSGLRTGANSAAAKAAVVAYRSPEQAAAKTADASVDVDTRTDVYALGAILYELLCGAPPFDPTVLRQAGMEAMARIIREEQPPAPSRRLERAALLDPASATAASVAAAAAAGEAAQARGAADPHALAKRLRGDLDAVVLKAMSKSRAARYDTANEFAADVRRYLAGEPVLARAAAGARGGRRYRAARWARRHWLGLTAGTVTALALLGGATAAAVGWWQAEQERRELEARVFRVVQRGSAVEQRMVQVNTARMDAERRAWIAASVSDYVESAFAAARWAAPAGGRGARVADVLDRAAAGAAREFAQQPEAEVRLRLTLAARYRALGLDADALANLRRAHELIRQNQMDWTEAGLRVALEYARLQASAERRYDAAERLARGALARARSRYSDWHPAARRARDVLGTVLAAAGAPAGEAEAEKLFRETVEHARQSSDSSESHDLAPFVHLARLLQRQRKLDEAEALYREALELARDNAQQPAAATAPASMPATAEATTRPALAAASSAGDAEDLSEVAVRLGLAAVLEARDRPTEAADEYRAALRLAEADELGGLHPATQLAAGRLVALLRSAGKPDEAQQLFRDRQQAAWSAAVALPAYDAAEFKRRGDFRARLGQFAQAADDYAAAIDHDPAEHWAWYYRACCLAYLARTADDPTDARRRADEYRRHGRAMLGRFADTSDPGVADRTAKAAALLPSEGAAAASADDWAVPLSLSDRALSADPRFRGWFLLGKGLLQYRAGQFDESAKTQAEARNNLPPGPTPFLTALATSHLIEAMARQRLGQPDEARRLLDEGRRRVAADVPKLEESDIGTSGLDNWWVCQVLLREAEQVVGGGAAPAGVGRQ